MHLGMSLGVQVSRNASRHTSTDVLKISLRNASSNAIRTALRDAFKTAPGDTGNARKDAFSLLYVPGDASKIAPRDASRTSCLEDCP